MKDKTMLHLNLEWRVLERNKVALIFDATTWSLFQETADSRGVDTQSMIIEALANALGSIVARRR